MGPVPAKYFWPGFIVALLSLSVGFGAWTVWSAMSDGGAKILEAKPLPPQPDPASESPEGDAEASVSGASESVGAAPTSSE